MERHVVDDRGMRWRVSQADAAEVPCLVFINQRGSQTCGPNDRRLDDMPDADLGRFLHDLRRWRLTELM